MKIGIIAPEFPPERGGVQTYALEYVRELVRRGHEVTVFTRRHTQVEVHPGGYQIEPTLRLRRRLDSSLLTRYSMDLWHVMNAAYSWLALETKPVFVTVHGNDFLWPYFSVARLDLRERLHFPFGSNADRWLGDWLTRSLVKRALPKAAHVFANSKYTEERLCQEVPGCRGRTSAAMVGVPADYYALSRPPRREGSTRLITVCRLAERHKNVDVVLRALSQLKDKSDYHYTIVGDGELRTSLESLARELELSSRVTFTGFVDQSRLRELLLESDLFVLPTSATPYAYEGFGLVYIEANACGCPVIAARIGGAVEAVKEGVTGIFVNEVSVDSIAEAVRRFLSGAVRFEAEDCVAFARRFSWEQVADHCFSHYERFVEACA
jgi:glycosyltransferase involved in cell wall biosynthesis